MNRSKLLLIALLLSAIWLTGCATANSSCPPLREYSREFQVQMALELEALPERAALSEAMADYSVLRQQVRACR